jgi:hypothetical protein
MLTHTMTKQALASGFEHRGYWATEDSLLESRPVHYTGRLKRVEGHLITRFYCCLFQRHHGLPGGASTGETRRLEEIRDQPG